MFYLSLPYANVEYFRSVKKFWGKKKYKRHIYLNQKLCPQNSDSESSLNSEP